VKGDLTFSLAWMDAHTHIFIKASCSRFNFILQSGVLCQFLLLEVISVW